MEGVQKFFNIKIKELKTMASAEAVTNKDELIKTCAGKIAENIERQLYQISFLNK